VSEASGGVEALALYASRPHDIVLLDLDMPGMSGEATQIELARRDPSVRIVFASGHADPLREAVVLERGARAFLQKPYEVDVLIAAIQSALRDDRFAFEERTDVGRRR
jgi:DNA-binding NarL/FixJ family response regulator